MKEVSELAAVGECALPGGFRATATTLLVRVIDGAVRVVARIGTIDTLVFVVFRWERCQGAVVRRGFDSGPVLA